MSSAQKMSGTWIPTNMDCWSWSNQSVDANTCKFFEDAKNRCSLDLQNYGSQIQGCFHLSTFDGNLHANPLNKIEHQNCMRGYAMTTSKSSWTTCNVSMSLKDADTVLKISWHFIGGIYSDQTHITYWSRTRVRNRRLMCLIS